MVLMYLMIRDLVKFTVWVLMGMVDCVVWVLQAVNEAIEASNERKDASDGTDEAEEDEGGNQARYSNRR